MGSEQGAAAFFTQHSQKELYGIEESHINQGWPHDVQPRTPDVVWFQSKSPPKPYRKGREDSESHERYGFIVDADDPLRDRRIDSTRKFTSKSYLFKRISYSICDQIDEQQETADQVCMARDASLLKPQAVRFKLTEIDQ